MEPSVKSKPPLRPHRLTDACGLKRVLDEPGDRRKLLSTLVITLSLATYFAVPNNTPGISHCAQAQTLPLLVQTPAPQAQPLQQVGANLLQPYFVKSMDSHNVRENTPLGEVVYTLEAQTEPQYPGLRFAYDIEGTHLFAVDRLSGQVRVAQPIDREQTGDSLSFHVVATPHFMNRPGTPTRLPITVYILDENDNSPRLERVRVGRLDYDGPALARLAQGGAAASAGLLQPRAPLIRLNVSEDAPVDSVLVDLIEAIDVDKASRNPLAAICLDCGPEFRLVPHTAHLLNDRLEWSIGLVKQLVHVPRNSTRQLHVLVSDGKFNTSLVFEVNVDDVQNKPPHFVSSTTCVVQENAPIDRTIMTLQALDGDAIAPDDGLASRPGSGAKLYSGRQIVYDFVDSSGQASSRQEDFKLHPLTGQLQVANRLDRESYLNLNGVLTLQVRARELTVDADTVVAGDDLYESILAKLTSFIDQSELASTMSDVTIILLDVNDNPPRWLNASEIELMNKAPVWHQALPADRDTGRHYHLRVRENSPPGSPITGRNEMFVYDLDSGPNAEFNISLEDPFNLFDVEPKQVSGFSSVTLKLAPGLRRQGRPLDYENINERSYIIQLHAIETSSQEQLRSKAQIQVDILDVNDNAPEFKEPAYAANIREDAPAGKTVKLVQASDRDEVSKQLTYSLHGLSARLFNINPLTGLITVAKCEPTGSSPATTARTRSSSSTNFIQQQQQQQQQQPRQCIDYETQHLHHLMVEASDGELSSKVPLTIWIEDASDNGPVFALPIVDVVIEEGAERLEPPIKIEASDVDQTSTLSYSIVEGNFEGLFSINNVTGELQLTRPIRIAHDHDLAASPAIDRLADFRQQHLNKMTLIVQASDGEHTANGTVRIDILDANDNAPKFSRAAYEREIPDSLGPGASVLTIKAFDMDRGNNARVSYRIERGSHSQFDINETTGEITVAGQAKPFETMQRDNYTLEVIAYDHGIVAKSSSALVLIRVLSSGRRAPEFSPQIQRESVNESTLNNTIVHRMTISEPQRGSEQQQQQQALAVVFEPGPIEGLDKYGQPVSEIERLESMFSVSTNTGDVVVNSGLNHDFAAYVNLTIFVSYRPLAATNYNLDLANTNSTMLAELETTQAAKSVGYLLINVLDDNEHAPMFAPPWTPSEPELSLRMLEELPVGSILTQLAASDADSKISHYEIDPPNEYFELASAHSGVIINKRLIDYDALMRQTFLSPSGHGKPAGAQAATGLGGEALLQAQQAMPNNIIQFNAIVYDSGLRQLSAKAIVSVEIMPVNDNDCKFEQQLYEARVRENAPADTLVAQVRANDLDYGEQHNSIVYQLLGDHRDFFHIDPRTGVVTVSARGSLGLDREQLERPHILLTVVGRDQEQVASGAGGLGAAGGGLAGRSCSASIRVLVEDVNDNPALFSQRLYETTAYDTDAPDVPLLKLLVHDDDDLKHQNTSQAGARNQQLSNSFRILSGNVNDSFNITPTGLLYALKPLNESLQLAGRPIELRVQVRQQALAPHQAAGLQPNAPALFTDECLVRVHLMRINRYAPEWRQESLKGLAVEENARPGTLVAQLKCQDRDLLEPNGGRVGTPSRSSFGASGELPAGRAKQAPAAMQPAGQPAANALRYWIKENGTNVAETYEFRLDPTTGQLTTRVELDRETRDLYQLIVACEDNGRPQSLESITPLYVQVLDQDDNRPQFVIPRQQQQQQQQRAQNEPSSQAMNGAKPAIPSISFAVEEHQSKGLRVGELKAVDRDLDSRFPILYCLLEGNEFGEFQLDQPTGTLYTNQTLDRERQANYELLVKAINDGSACEEHLATQGQVQAQVSSNQTGTNGGGGGSSKRPVPGAIESLLKVRVQLLDINDNAPAFRRSTFRAGVHHRALMNTLVAQVAAQDPDFELNGALSYRISEILLYKTNPSGQGARQRHSASSAADEPPGKPIKLIQAPFRIDQSGNVFTQQLLTQYQLMSMFVLSIEAREQAEPWRVASTKLEIYVYETGSQLKIRINLHPRFIDAYRLEIEQMLSNATKSHAIINRARSYYGNGLEPAATRQPQGPNQPASLDLAQAPGEAPGEPNFSNINAIFVDNHRLMNPHLVLERFDLASAQQFTPQSLSQQFSSNQLAGADPLARYNIGADGQANEVASLIDKVAPASASLASELRASGGGSALAAIDWLETPAALYVALSSMLALIGLLVCLAGCCCTSRIKDHIIKAAMDKLVRQQALQAKISERVMAATNQAYANSALQMAAAAAANGQQQQQDFLMHQNGPMSSFDATKGCINNNYENMSILRRALEAGEYIDPNYTTLGQPHHHLNLGAHYYNPNELEQDQEQEQPQNGAHELQANGLNKQTNGSVISLSLSDEQDGLDEQLGLVQGDRGAGAADLNQLQLEQLKAGAANCNGHAAAYSGALHQQQPRQRQQVPPGQQQQHELHEQRLFGP